MVFKEGYIFSKITCATVHFLTTTIWCCNLNLRPLDLNTGPRASFGLSGAFHSRVNALTWLSEDAITDAPHGGQCALHNILIYAHYQPILNNNNKIHICLHNNASVSSVYDCNLSTGQNSNSSNTATLYNNNNNNNNNNKAFNAFNSACPASSSSAVNVESFLSSSDWILDTVACHSRRVGLHDQTSGKKRTTVSTRAGTVRPLRTSSAR